MPGAQCGLGDSVLLFQFAEQPGQANKLLIVGCEPLALGSECLGLRTQSLILGGEQFGLLRQRPLLLLHFTQQQGRELVVSDPLDRAGLIPNDEIRIDPVHFFGDQAILERALGLRLQVKGYGAQLLQLGRPRRGWA